MKHLKNVKELVDNNNVTKVVTENKQLPIKHFSSTYKSNTITSREQAQEFLKNKKFEELLILDMDLQILEIYIILSLWKKSKSKLLLLSFLPIPYFSESPTYNIESKISEIRYLDTDLINLVYETDSLMPEGDFVIYTLPNLIEETKNKLKDISRKIIVTSEPINQNFLVAFDLLKENRIVPTLTGGARMEEQYVSQKDANLRVGDITYRFISEHEFNNLPISTPEIIYRLPLHHMMIDIYNYGLDAFEILSDFQIQNIDFVFSLFIKYNIIDYNYKVTKKGKSLRSLPLGIRTALLCLENRTFSNIVLASCIENFSPDIFIFYQGEKDYQVEYQNHIRKYFERFRGLSDIDTLLNIYKFSKEEAKSFKNVEKWAADNYISYSYLKNFYFTIEKVSKILNVEKVGEFEKDSSITDIYIEKEMSLILDSDTYVQYMDYKGEVYQIDSESINSIEPDPPLKIYGLILSDNPNTISLSYIF